MIRIVGADIVLPPARERTRRLVLSVTWALVAAFVVGVPAAYLVSPEPGPTSYEAVGTLWIAGDAGVGFGESVLRPVVLAQQLYLSVPESRADAFSSFEVIGPLGPGTYRLRVGDVPGEGLTLVDEEGRLIQTATFGSPVGEVLGFLWSPSRHALAPGATVEFSLVTLDEAARDLAASLEATMDGNQVRVSLSGPDPRKVIDVVDAVMRRYAEVASDANRLDWSKMRPGGRLSERPVISVPFEGPTPEEMGAVVCSFGGTLEDREAIEPTPLVRVLDNAVLRRSEKESRVPVAVLAFAGCFCLAFGGALRLSRTALMDNGEI